MALISDINFDQGTDISFPFYLVDRRERPLDLNGYSARMYVRKAMSSKVIDSLSVENGRLFLKEYDIEEEAFKKRSFKPNSIIVTFPHETTEKYPAGLFNYDVELISPSGYVYRLFEGLLKCHINITR